MESRVAQLETEVTSLQVELGRYKGQLEEQKQKLMDDIGIEFANTKLALGEIVVDARAEFAKLQQGITELHQGTLNALTELTKRMEIVEKGGTGKVQKGYLPTKSTIPKVMGGQEEDWRQWKEDTEDFMDDTNPGMKKFLREVAMQKDGPK